MVRRMKLTAPQSVVLRAIYKAEVSSSPRLPTVRDVSTALGYAGPSSVAYHLRRLRKLKLLLPQSGRFGLVLTAAGRQEARR